MPGAQRRLPPRPRLKPAIKRFIAAVRGFIARNFPEREVLLRAHGRVRFFRVSCAAQCVAVALIALLVPCVIYGLTINIFFPGDVLAAKNAEIERAQQAYDRLRAESADYQAHYRMITQQLESKHRYLLDVMAQNAALRGDLAETSGRLKNTDAERHRLLASRQALLTQIDELDASLRTMRTEKDLIAGDLGERDVQLREEQAKRARALAQRNQLQVRSDELQRRLTDLQTSQDEVLGRLAARTRGSIGELRDVIAMTGLDADRLLSNIGAGAGLGGPFVEARADSGESHADLQIAALNSHIDQWGELQQVLRRLPLSAPIDNYVEMSPFGKRRDPINGKLAVHSGVDLAGPTKAAIMSTAPGVVVFAGTHEGYGRMVEIDHGMGVRSRYGHLSSIVVRKGQTVNYRQTIGVIGNSGRTTGIHLHYEVLVNDRPHDPMRFIEAGKHVFKG